ncbi:hypothetical protein [Chitinophaga sp. YIM B06452]|uniref:hypothetical protein n=1 Tax=Chitinophaga sp. YIM B06452 TaxID=3082158 RepID=UPI0031FEB00F
MSTPVSNSKRVIVIYWKNQDEHPFEVFSNLKNFCLSYPEYNYNTLNNYLSKGKVPFENKEVRVERKNVFSQPKPAISMARTGRMIVPVARKVALKDAHDTSRDWEYWLNQSPSKRLAAVTFIITQSLGKNTRMDKTVVSSKTLKS